MQLQNDLFAVGRDQMVQEQIKLRENSTISYVEFHGFFGTAETDFDQLKEFSFS